MAKKRAGRKVAARKLAAEMAALSVVENAESSVAEDTTPVVAENAAPILTEMSASIATGCPASSASGHPALSASDVYEIRPSAEKGNGVFALRDIKPGEVVMIDHQVMQIYGGGTTRMIQHTDDEVRQAFDKLQPDQQAQFLVLHEGSRPFKTKLLRIFKTNAFGGAEGAYIYLNISAINHSCLPNAQVIPRIDEVAEVMATQAIARNEEILICYNDLSPCMTARQRGTLLYSHYGFVCECPSCALQGHARMLSDARRQLLTATRYPTSGHMVPDFSRCDTPIVEDIEAPVLSYQVQDLATPLAHSTLCAYSLLLAKLLEAEGLMGDLCVAYLRAADALHAQMMAMDDIVFLQSAKYVKSWAEKAIEIASQVDGQDGPSTVALQQHWESMQSERQLRIAVYFVSAYNLHYLH